METDQCPGHGWWNNVGGYCAHCGVLVDKNKSSISEQGEEKMTFSAEIGWAVVDELSNHRGRDLRDLIQDEKTYEELVDNVIDVIEEKLRIKAEKINKLLVDWDVK